MAEKKTEDTKKRPIIIKKVKKVVGGGHHGGAWKVAYADFVTAMMAFFLLLWLLNVATQEQLNGIADYFRPTLASVSQSGAGGVMGGVSAVTEGAMRTELVNDITDTIPSTIVDDDSQSPDDEEADEQGKKKLSQSEFEKMKAAEEEKNFEDAKKELMSAIENDAQLKELAKNLIVDMTPEGLRIQIVDQQGKSMFPLGSAKMYDETYMLISKVAQVVAKLPNRVSINGHTDSVPYGTNATYNNWDLSSERANASRRALVASGLDAARIANVSGKAEIDPLFPKDTTNPQNRRISIILMRQHPTGGTPAPQNVNQLRETSTNPNYNQPFRARVPADIP
ncbi:MAG TPA: flagellar motor protein MotB [Alphaproteobacteria bacterium]